MGVKASRSKAAKEREVAMETLDRWEAASNLAVERGPRGQGRDPLAPLQV